MNILEAKKTGRKVMRAIWTGGYMSLDNMNDILRLDNVFADDWEVEPPEKKRYWLWKLRQHGDSWFKTDTYQDENGFTTNGLSKGNKWEVFEKIKCENDFVEV